MPFFWTFQRDSITLTFLHQWCRSFLLGRTQKVIVDGTSSDTCPVLSGVPQGTVLGPLFFLIYINDITENLSPGTMIRLFADDSLLYRTINSQDDVDTLQKDLDLLQSWEVTWKMEFHPQKCQLLKITKKIKFINSKYNIHGFILEETNAAKYLGVVIDSKLNWKNQYSAIRKKANKILAFLRRNLKDCPTHIKAHCYKTLVRPVLEYGCAVWDPNTLNDIQDLEKIQKRAGRFCSNNYIMENGNTNINMSKLKWKPLEERRAQNKLKLFYKAKENLIEIPFSQIKMNNNSTRRGGRTYQIEQSCVNSHLFSFHQNTVRLWNSLPDTAKDCRTFEGFKQALDNLTIRSSYPTNI